jgi:hypothetical protein
MTANTANNERTINEQRCHGDLIRQRVVYSLDANALGSFVVPRITVSLQASERDALVKLAEIERRDPRAQAALIIRDELARRGLLAADPTPMAARVADALPILSRRCSIFTVRGHKLHLSVIASRRRRRSNLRIGIASDATRPRNDGAAQKRILCPRTAYQFSAAVGKHTGSESSFPQCRRSRFHRGYLLVTVMLVALLFVGSLLIFPDWTRTNGWVFVLLGIVADRVVQFVANWRTAFSAQG